MSLKGGGESNEKPVERGPRGGGQPSRVESRPVAPCAARGVLVAFQSGELSCRGFPAPRRAAPSLAYQPGSGPNGRSMPDLPRASLRGYSAVVYQFDFVEAS